MSELEEELRAVTKQARQDKIRIIEKWANQHGEVDEVNLDGGMIVVYFDDGEIWNVELSSDVLVRM
jgi:hypothetical protein